VTAGDDDAVTARACDDGSRRRAAETASLDGGTTTAQSLTSATRSHFRRTRRPANRCRCGAETGLDSTECP